MINLYTPSEELWNTLSEEHFKAKGWSYRTIYKMVQFYETYSS